MMSDMGQPRSSPSVNVTVTCFPCRRSFTGACWPGCFTAESLLSARAGVGPTSLTSCWLACLVAMQAAFPNAPGVVQVPCGSVPETVVDGAGFPGQMRAADVYGMIPALEDLARRDRQLH